MMSFDFNSVPNVSDSSPLKKANELLEMVRHIEVIIVSEVAHDGIASVNHDRVAKAKIAMTRCWITVSPWMPNTSVGRFQMTAVMMTITSNSIIFFLEYLLFSALEVVSVAMYDFVFDFPKTAAKLRNNYEL